MYEIKSLYEDYAKAIFRYLLSLGCDSQTAEDIVQETFCQAIKSIGRYNGTCKISVWLCQIAKHLWYKEIRKRKKRPQNALTEDISDFENDITEAYIEKETREKVKSFTENLPEHMRQVVEMRIYGNMSFKEIGIILGKTENWARVTYYRGKEKIMKGWDNDEI